MPRKRHHRPAAHQTAAVEPLGEPTPPAAGAASTARIGNVPSWTNLISHPGSVPFSSATVGAAADHQSHAPGAAASSHGISAAPHGAGTAESDPVQVAILKREVEASWQRLEESFVREAKNRQTIALLRFQLAAARADSADGSVLSWGEGDGAPAEEGKEGEAGAPAAALGRRRASP